MARGNKRGSSTPRGGGKRGRGRGQHRSNAVPSRETYFSYTHEVFSLADEARNTGHHRHWDTNSNLRSKPVAFVSAGTSEPLKQLDDDILRTRGSNGLKESQSPVENQMTPDAPTNNISGTCPSPKEAPQELPGDGICLGSLNGKQEDGSIPDPDGLFFFDLRREEPRTTPHEQHVPSLARPPDAAHSETSSSDEEVILFKGRDTSTQPSRRDKPPINLTSVDAEIRHSPDHQDQVKGQSKSPIRKTPPSRHQRMHREDDDILADYIANLQENGEMQSLISLGSRNIRDLGGSDDGMDVQEGSGCDGTGTGNPAQRHGEASPQPGLLHQADCSNHDTAEGQYSSQSELDDDLLAKLIAGQDLSDSPNQPWEEEESSSSSSDTDDEAGPKYRQFEVDDFDLMDWDRPSLRQKKKGKASRAQLPIDLSDDELEESIQIAWKNDRLKKSQRKKQREELRALGMLGKNSSKPGDMKVKYPEGMNLQQVAEEIKGFLRGADASLSFPPMDTHARKMIHELANKFNIKSKSSGKSDQRRAVLYRTGRTLPYAETAFEQAVARINRRYFPRLDTKGKRTKQPGPSRSNDAAASYREGEVVGATAPELGIENRGRAMLEKMGWSRGTALGAMDNKGILQPVPQTMKKSKAGLG